MKILIFIMFLNFLNCSMDRNIFKFCNIHLVNKVLFIDERTELLFFNIFKEGLLVDYLQKKVLDCLIKSLFIKTSQIFNFSYLNNIISFYLVNLLTDFLFFLKNSSSSISDIFFIINFFII